MVSLHLGIGQPKPLETWVSPSKLTPFGSHDASSMIARRTSEFERIASILQLLLDAGRADECYALWSATVEKHMRVDCRE
eukprot:7026412-Alexandrium_andersonii.AAC.1